MQATGIVLTIFPDDLKGSKHQRFTVKISHHKTVLVVHNIDIAKKIENLTKGDQISFKGVYQWNKHGGMVHWTHRDPHKKHANGWIKHKGKLYC